jgi:hypothetical protein
VSGITISHIYGPPKTHREEAPLRSIINTIDSPTYNIVKYWAKMFASLIGHTSSFLKESTYFIDNIKKYEYG